MKQRYQRGFTFLEILVVLAIIGLISAVVIVNTRSGGGQLALERSAQQVAQDIRRQLSLVLEGRTFANCPGGETLDGYGIHFETDSYDTTSLGPLTVDEAKTSYLLFAECDNSFEYDDGDDGDMELVQLEQGVRIQQLRENVPVSPDVEAKLDITFEPPDPVVYLKGGVADFEIILELVNNPSQTKTITVNNAGIVTVQ